jgi:hypothetical protein
MQHRSQFRVPITQHNQLVNETILWVGRSGPETVLAHPPLQFVEGTMLVMRTLVFGAVLLVIASAGFHSLISASLAAAQDAKATTFSERLCPALKSPLGWFPGQDGDRQLSRPHIANSRMQIAPAARASVAAMDSAYVQSLRAMSERETWHKLSIWSASSSEGPAAKRPKKNPPGWVGGFDVCL